MDERLRFFAKLLEGESMSELCREFGISRKTGSKIFNRYYEHGIRGAERPTSTAGTLRQPAAYADREPHRQDQARQAEPPERHFPQGQHPTWHRAHPSDLKEGSDPTPRHEHLQQQARSDDYRAAVRGIGNEGASGVQLPLQDRDVVVTACARICVPRERINVSQVLAGQRVDITEVDDGIWMVSFMHSDLGYIDPRLPPMS